MKTKNILMSVGKRLILLLAILTIGVRYAGAATTGTITFGNGTGDLTISSGSVNGNDSQSNTWYVTVSGSGVYYAQNANYSQVGSKANPATSIQFQMTLGSSQTVSALSFTCTGTSDTRGRVTLKIGDTVIGTDSVSGSSEVTIANTGWTSGTVLTVLITNITAGFKCQTISYTYGETMRTVNWMVNGNAAGGTPTTSVPNGAKVMTLPTTPTSSDCDGSKVFVGWSAAAIDGATNTRPTDLFTTAAGSPAVTGTTTYYAVFATATAGTGPWEKLKASTIPEGDYLIAELYGSSHYMMNHTLSESKLGGTVVTVTNDTISRATTTYLWHIKETATTGVYTIKKGNDYLVSTGTEKEVAFTTSPSDDKELWTITYESSTKEYTFTNNYNDGLSVKATLRYGGSAYTCYTAASHEPYIFKRGVGYTNYATTCCTNYDITLQGGGTISGGTISTNPSAACATATITLNASICSGYTWDGKWKIYKDGDEETTITPSGDGDGATFTMPAYDVVVGVKNTPTAKVDHFIDAMQKTENYTGDGYAVSGCNQTVPSLDDAADADEGDGCGDRHNLFVGWVISTSINADGTLKSGYTIVSGGTTSWNASGATYYAIWAEKE